MYSSLPRIELTTIDQRKELLAKSSVNLLKSLIDAPASGEYIRKTIMPELIVRGSCAKRPACGRDSKGA